MDNTPGLSEKRGSSLTNGPSFRRPAGSPTSHLATTPLPAAFTTTITIHRDDRGYGMKVSGDNPVYVQSVKEGGAAERAGLHSGDTIVKVNGVNVLHLTHTEVVELIKAATEVVLTVQQNPVRRERAMTGAGNAMSSPSLHRAASQPRDRITGPQPVDHEQKRQLEFQKTNTLKLMLEKEQMYVESLRSNLAKCKDPTSESNILQKLHRAEKSVQTLQQQLSELEGQEAPPLPSRNSTPPRPPPVSPPPLPPRQYLLHSQSTIFAERAFAESTALGAVGQVPQSHHRTKSSPDSLSTDLLTEASKRLIASESMTELCFAKKSRGGVAWEVEPGPSRPPGTPPPPYMSDQQSPEEHNYCQIPEDDILPIINNASDLQDNSPNKTIGGFTIHSPTQVQQPIISMEDEDMSDQEMTQTENHGPFKSLSKLWSHQVHLAVFLNYVISNSDPSSLLFYLLTDLYKEGSAKEMKKWAYEIHSSFLVPTAPLRVSNVDENVAREIDDVLANESDKEEILRKVFWKARQKAKEELNEQLADFQSKRTAGMGTMYGPNDAELEECLHDKSKELKVIETILVPKFEPYLLDIERGDVDDKRFSTGAALGTVMGKVFGIRGTHFNSLLERCLTYVSKDKSLKARLIGKTRKVTKKGHHCIAHQYYTVTYCNHCQNIIWGIGPQGYQCTNCGLNIHRNCVTQLEEVCPGPMVKKEKAPDRIRNLMDRIRPENTRRKPSHSLPHEKSKRHLEEDSSTVLGDTDSGDRTRSEKRPEPVRETGEESWRLSRQPSTEQHPDHPESNDVSHHHHHPQHNPPPQPQHVTKTKCNNASISRSESYKERIHQKRQLRERRKTSDPNLSKTNNDVEVESQPFANLNKSHSGSSSNSSLSTSLESPSNSTEAVSGTVREPWDSDMDAEAVQPEWTTSIPEEVRESMSEDERKRQEIINELFHTEKSHVRGLKVLERVFYRPMKEREILSPDQLNLLFANLEEMVAVHSTFNTSMKAKRSESPIVGDIGHLLLHMFDGPTGERFQKAAAMFCAQQHNSLELLKEKRKKDQKFHNFLTEAEMNSVCRRLQLKDILPTGWQRLTKYPLLLENLVKYSAEVDGEEKERLQRALDRSKEVLNFVDSAVKEAENQTRLAEIQKRLDTGPFDKMDYPIVNEYRNLDLTKHRLLYEGPLNWRIQNRQKLLDLHVLLLEDAIILLQKQDEKFVLKFYSQALSPVIKVSTVLVRHNAVDKQALFLVNTSHNGAQIYDLRASCPLDKRKWFKHISDAAESYKTKDSKYKNREPPASDEVPDNLDKNKESEENETGGELAGASPSPGTTPQPPASPAPGSNQASPRLDKSDNESIRRTESGSGGGPELLAATYIEEGALVEPSQVLVCTRDVHTAQPVLTPLEKLRRKDEAVKQALYEKQILVADLLHVPREDFDTIADLAGETTAADKEPSELILAAVSQASALSLVVNEALRVSEEEAVNASVSPGHIPGVPAHRIQAIATALNSQLSHLLKIMNDRDEERERLRRELQKSREQLHALHERREPNGFPEQESCREEPPSETSPPPAPPPPSEVFVDALSEEVTSSLEANVEEEEDISASNKEP